MFVNEKTLDISVVMPCLDEEDTVGYCIDEARQYISSHGMDGEIIVVDNGCTDHSAERAREHGAVVIVEERRGYGRAIRTGIEHSRGGIIVISDCDSTYDLLHLDGFCGPLQRGEADMVIGDRFAGGIERGAMPLSHMIGAPVLSLMARLRFHTDVKDFHCGLRSFTREAAEIVSTQCDGMEFATGTVARAVREGLRIAQIPTTLRCAKGQHVSKLNAVRDGLRHLRYILFTQDKK